jgi:hypothetical protein
MKQKITASCPCGKMDRGGGIVSVLFSGGKENCSENPATPELCDVPLVGHNTPKPPSFRWE